MTGRQLYRAGIIVAGALILNGCSRQAEPARQATRQASRSAAAASSLARPTLSLDELRWSGKLGALYATPQ